MINLLSSLTSKVFSSSFPDVEFSIGHDRAEVEVTVTKSGEDTVIYDEFLYPGTNNLITLSDIDQLIKPYADKWLVFDVTISITEQSVDTDGDSTDQSTRELSTTVVSCCALILNQSAEDFCSSHFLTLFSGVRDTAEAWLEYLCYIGTDTPSCQAHYSDGSSQTFAVTVLSDSGDYTMIDVSSANFLVTGKSLISFTITAGSRSQTYHVGNFGPDCAPALLFFNSFGVQEIAYCTGEHQMVASFERKQARIGRLNEVYHNMEKETFKADTGILTFAMAKWWREVFRSKDIRLLPIYDDQVELDEGIPVVITSEKSEISNAADSLPRFTFEYEYADRNHNIFDVRREGRIFDDSFDYTFN